MDDLKDKSLKELADRLNEIMVERNQLDMEHNRIVHELWERIPRLKDDPNLEIKEEVKTLRLEPKGRR